MIKYSCFLTMRGHFEFYTIDYQILWFARMLYDLKLMFVEKRLESEKCISIIQEYSVVPLSVVERPLV